MVYIYSFKTKADEHASMALIWAKNKICNLIGRRSARWLVSWPLFCARRSNSIVTLNVKHRIALISANFIEIWLES